MKLRFAKMHGLGNDFMVIDAINQRFVPEPQQVRAWANRFSGIGFDQMLMVEPTQHVEAAFKYRIFNADGGEVAQCGNGARCFARFVREQGLTDLDTVPVETNTGLLRITAIDTSRFQVDMGVPLFEPDQIPLHGKQRQLSYRIEEEGREFAFSALSIGNPHMVMQVESVEDADVDNLGPLFESHAMFPERTNVGFMQVIDRNTFALRVYERGVGETRACGSGACAAMVAGVQLDLLDQSATAILAGGELNMEWHGESNPVMMTGETAMVYQGEVEYG